MKSCPTMMSRSMKKRLLYWFRNLYEEKWPCIISDIHSIYAVFFLFKILVYIKWFFSRSHTSCARRTGLLLLNPDLLFWDIRLDLSIAGRILYRNRRLMLLGRCKLSIYCDWCRSCIRHKCALN